MHAPLATPPIQMYQLKITLRHVTPMVWRRLLVPSTTTIAHLHSIIQTVMGWDDLHVHRFCIYGIYRSGGFGFDDDPTVVCLADFRWRAGERFLYDYDMGALWQHDIWLEHIHTAETRPAVPCCIAGAGDCPPEDCGGPAGYRVLLRELVSWHTSEEFCADMLLIAERVTAFAHGGPQPTTEDLDFMEALDRLRAREDWCPTAFNRRAVNRALRALEKE